MSALAAARRAAERWAQEHPSELPLDVLVMALERHAGEGGDLDEDAVAIVARMARRAWRARRASGRQGEAA